MIHGELRPDRIVPDPDGGVVFEEHLGNVTKVLHIRDDMSPEYYSVLDGRIVERWPVTLTQLEFCETNTSADE